MRKFLLVASLFLLMKTAVVATVNYSLYIDFIKSNNMRFIVIASEDYPQALIVNQLIVEHINKLGYAAEYVPDNKVLESRISRIYSMIPSNIAVPEIYVISHRYFLRNTTSKLRGGLEVTEIMQGCIIDVNRANYTRNFKVEDLSTVAQAELYEINDNLSRNINEMFNKVLSDIFR
jgi:hypothetical protein